MRIFCVLCCFCKSVQGESAVFLRRKRGYAIQWSCSLSERAQIYSRYFLRGGACSTRSLAICCHPNQCTPDSKANLTIVLVQNKARNEASKDDFSLLSSFWVHVRPIDFEYLCKTQAFDWLLGSNSVISTKFWYLIGWKKLEIQNVLVNYVLKSY